MSSHIQIHSACLNDRGRIWEHPFKTQDGQHFSEQWRVHITSNLLFYYLRGDGPVLEGKCCPGYLTAKPIIFIILFDRTDLQVIQWVVVNVTASWIIIGFIFEI